MIHKTSKPMPSAIGPAATDLLGTSLALSAMAKAQSAAVASNQDNQPVAW
jgi:hypothetical protein